METDNIYIIFFILSFFACWTGYKKTKSIFNPITLFSFSMLISVISVFLCEKLNLLKSFKTNDVHDVIFLYIIAIISFIIPWLKPPKIEGARIYNKNLKSQALILSYIIISCLILMCFILGEIPIISMIKGDSDINQSNLSLYKLPLGLSGVRLVCLIILNLYVSSFIVNRKQYKISIKEIVYFFIVCFLASSWQGKRQGIFMLLFMIIARYYQKNVKINFQQILSGIVICIIFFVFFYNVRQIRINDSENKEDNLTELLSYSVSSTLNMIVISKYYSVQENHYIPNFVFADIVPQRYKSIQLNNEVYDLLYNKSSPNGYISAWYIDYRYLGVFLGSFGLSLFSLICFSKKNRSEYDMQLYILTLWCCATSSVYAHFISLVFFILPFFIISLLKRHSKKIIL